jgi:hypothetical protein
MPTFVEPASILVRYRIGLNDSRELFALLASGMKSAGSPRLAPVCIEPPCAGAVARRRGEADRTRAQEAGLTFLQKPFQLAEFRGAITPALARSVSAEDLAPESPPKKPLSKAADEGQSEAEEGRGSA